MVLSYSLHQSCMILSLLPQNLMVLSTLLQNRVDLYLSTCFRASWFSHLLQSRMDYSFLQSCMVSSPFTLEPRGLFFSPKNLVVLPIYFGAAWSLLSFRAAWSLLSLWLPGLGLNPSAHLPLQPHFRLLLQSATPASIPIFFQLYWAAIVSLGRCGPMAWSQSCLLYTSPSPRDAY